MSQNSKNNSQELSLRGSAKKIVEFFEITLGFILYQRGVYPQDEFVPVTRYGMSLLRPESPDLRKYIRTVLQQVQRWVVKGDCSKLLLCLVDTDSGSTIEQWAFGIDISESGSNSNEDESADNRINEEETKQQIRALLRQITSSVSFLPQLDEDAEYSFCVLCHTNASGVVPKDWGDASMSTAIVHGSNKETVQLRNFATSDHTIQASVTYSSGK
ncbi:hypothetical protein TBLA_0D03440 [Henningerozyma blattae CBS 6284]|uniref:HORMA domain-containing protein n=1 Tax=Henningerozyma blattae (strain ATCC 34711 / CBS 6284 / DSM 70876 / NBRC 10599 / NRRL Y-10934 / UCD 77-7) TaxID=1071380 RepID=I2H392_HENB6|nr:hypothetical protein TBLA_0D03440 [Tetrapisispora blattae CBS 6284]CCH60844.1 hypothetical protein TBLA_0D03440 [Tetrapisispora blattae CBS 6284]